jgi:hypothetical protein
MAEGGGEEVGVPLGDDLGIGGLAGDDGRGVEDRGGEWGRCG